MSNLEKHISDLLMHNNCVVVPRLGGLVGSYQSARFFEDGGVCNPPYKEIIFNKALSHNDGLVIDSYSRKYNISYADAEKDVYSFVDELLKKVAKGEFVQIAEIGTFRADLLGNLYFIQSEGVNFLAQSFGFDTLQVLPLTQGERNSQRFDGRNSRLFIRMITNRRVAASVAAAVGLFIFSTNIAIKDFDKSNYSSLINDLEFGSIAVSPIVTLIEAPVVAVPLVESKKNNNIILSPTASVAIVERVNEPYHLIAASVKNRDEANKLVASFIKEGKADAKVVEADGRYRISIEQFATRELALEAMDKLRQDAEFKSVWVFKNK